MSESPKIGSDHVVAHVEDSRLEPGKKDLQSAIRLFNEDEKHMSTWQAARAYRRVLLISLVPFLCGMTYGYDTVASSATMAMPAFLLSFGETDPATGSLFAPSLWSALWTALTNLGQALGSFVMGFVAQRIGRRYAIVSCACISAAGVTVQYTASTRWALLIGKIIVGFAIGGLLALGTTYASDIAPIRLRGPILQALVFSTVAMQGTALGMIRGFVLSVASSAWKMVFAIQWIVGSLPLVVPYLYNTDAANLGAKTGFVFAGLTACLFVVSWVLVPDTAGLSVDEIDAAYRESVAPRKLRAWVEAR